MAPKTAPTKVPAFQKSIQIQFINLEVRRHSYYCYFNPASFISKFHAQPSLFLLLEALVVHLADVILADLDPSVLLHVVEVHDTTGHSVTVRGVHDCLAAQIVRLFNRHLVLVAWKSGSETLKQINHYSILQLRNDWSRTGIHDSVSVGGSRSNTEHVVCGTLTVAVDVVEAGSTLVPSTHHCTHGQSHSCKKTL